ncbi:hypothetical protein CKM354_000081800 [Cercospora kikuchii]|uniref:Uncharacterized protein n=1 Tax=Cercospora kikuchii TaxID=84275 RepID=A0A9P3CBL2_9PEZI|nr:uncharacterized protein CKM354_000081800 [Cercospora kikuchii]GIZ37370.1 hypothetical protein CKM354_000081800 [Cercospora kikuchii]
MNYTQAPLKIISSHSQKHQELWTSDLQQQRTFYATRTPTGNHDSSTWPTRDFGMAMGGNSLALCSWPRRNPRRHSSPH